MTKVLEPGILKTKNFERMANDWVFIKTTQWIL
jgi:hypothetical protein